MLTINQSTEIINKEIEEIALPANPSELYEPIRYILSLGGKRLRPAITLMTHSFYNDTLTEAIRPALAIEVFHNFTLMHDDMMDHSNMRRGKETVHIKWNNNIALLSGDAMLIAAYKLLEGINNNHLAEVFKTFNTTALEVCEGQQYDMNFEFRNDVNEAEYIEMIRLKTSVLIGCALKIGAITGGAEAHDKALLYDIGRDLGIGFQLQDDLLDAFGDPSVFGKKIGGDIIANKKTYLLIKSIERANPASAKEIQRLIQLKNADSEKIIDMLNIYRELNIEMLTEQKIDTYFDKSYKMIEKINAGEQAKINLIEFADILRKRKV